MLAFILEPVPPASSTNPTELMSCAKDAFPFEFDANMLVELMLLSWKDVNTSDACCVERVLRGAKPNTPVLTCEHIKNDIRNLMLLCKQLCRYFYWNFSVI